MVIVVGDVNSTLAGALAAAKLNIPIAHIEAGLRSYDRTMPEEINRKVTDSVSDYLFTPSADASENLRKENIPEERIFFVGNIMVDSLVHSKDKAAGSDILTRLGLLDGRFCLVTLHRPGNVDDPVILRRILQAIESISRLVDVVIPLHPRTRDRLSDYGLLSSLERNEGIRLSQPLGYLDFLKLEMSAQFVMTDSGGVQEETRFLSIPCLTLRENTERPITAIIGTNTLVGSDPGTIVTKATEIISGAPRRGTRPELWDGETAHRIARILSELLVKA